MKLAGTYTFEAPTQVVWDALFDPEVLAATLPGCEGLVREGDEFTGDINVKMGPVQGRFKGKVNVTDQDPPKSYTMIVNGRGPAGLVKATAKIALSELEAERTEMAYAADVSVGGRIASVGQRLLDASSRAIVKQSLEGLNRQISARVSQVQRAARDAGLPGAAADSPVAPESQNQTDTTGSGPNAAPTPAVASAGPEARVVNSDDLDSANVATPDVKPTEESLPKNIAAPQVSQAAFMAGVAKEMGKELLPPRALAKIAVAAVLLLAVLFLLR